MTFLPIVERELREASRRRSVMFSRVGFALVAALVVGLALLFTGAAPQPGAGGGVFRFMVWLVFTYALGAGLVLTADCLSRERREGTLGLMFLTDLRGYDVVLGKLVGRSLTAVYGLLAVLPMLAAAILLGGVRGQEFWACVAACLNTLFLSLSVCLLMSTVSRDEHASLWRSVVVLGVLGVVVPVAVHLPAPIATVGVVLAQFSPWSAVVGAFENVGVSALPGWWQCMAGVHLVGWSCLAASCWWLPRSWQEGEASAGAPQSARRVPVPESGAGEAVAWLVLRTFLARGRAVWVGVTALTLLLAAVDLLQGGVKLHWTGVGLSWLLRALVAMQASRFFSEARRDGSLELLLGSPLPESAMVDGVWIALRRRFLGPAVLGVTVLMLPGAYEGPAAMVMGAMDLGVGAIVGALQALTLGADLVMAGWLGMFLGLTGRHPRRAPVFAVLYAVVLPEILRCVPNLLIDFVIIMSVRDRVPKVLRRMRRGEPHATEHHRVAWNLATTGR